MDEHLKNALAQITELTAELTKRQIRLDALETEHTATKKTLATVEAERDTLKDKLVTSEKLRTDGESSAVARARARVRLEDTAMKILTVDGVTPKFEDKITDRQIQEKVIIKLTGKEIPAGKTDDYISARFDSLTEDSATQRSNEQNAMNEVLAGLNPVKLNQPTTFMNQDGTPDVSKMTAADAQRYNAQRDQTRWQNKNAK